MHNLLSIVKTMFVVELWVFLLGGFEFEFGGATTHCASWGSLKQKPKDCMQCTKRQAHEEPLTKRTKRQPWSTKR